MLLVTPDNFIHNKCANGALGYFGHSFCCFSHEHVKWMVPFKWVRLIRHTIHFRHFSSILLYPSAPIIHSFIMRFFTWQKNSFPKPNAFAFFSLSRLMCISRTYSFFFGKKVDVSFPSICNGSQIKFFHFKCLHTLLLCSSLSLKLSLINFTILWGKNAEIGYSFQWNYEFIGTPKTIMYILYRFSFRFTFVKWHAFGNKLIEWNS